MVSVQREVLFIALLPPFTAHFVLGEDDAVKSKDGNVISTYSSFSEGIRKQ